MVDWGLTALLTQIRSYRAFKVKTTLTFTMPNLQCQCQGSNWLQALDFYRVSDMQHMSLQINQIEYNLNISAVKLQPGTKW